MSKKDQKKNLKGGHKGIKDLDDPDALTDSEIIEETEEEEAVLEEAVEENLDEVEDDDDLGDAGNEIDDEDIDDEKELEEADEELEEVEGDADDDACLYKFSKKRNKDLEEDEDLEEVYFFEEENINNDLYVPNEKRISKPNMTKYERVCLLCIRTQQLSLGAKPMIKNVNNMSPEKIAKLELENGKIPLIIGRTLPNGQKEKWKCSELNIVN